MKGKNQRISIFLLAILALFLTSYTSAQGTQNTSTQEKAIEAKVYLDIQAKAERNLRGKSYRLTKTEEFFSDRTAQPESVNIRLFETVPPDKTREVEELKSANRNTKTERIWDGKNLYTRENNGEWHKYIGGGSGSGDFESGRITNSYRFIEKTTLNDEITNVYEMESHRKAVKFTRTSGFEIEYVTKTRIWINEIGNILKKVIELERIGSNALSRDIWIYEYDPNIKIEAPIK